MGHPKVFISYCHTTPKHEKRVLSFSRSLVSAGIDVILDQWELYPGHDQYDFMERIDKDKTIDKILIICDSGYKFKADRNKGGVGVEAQIIRPEVYDNTNQGKYIPVIFEKSENGEALLPVFLKSKMYIDLVEEHHFSEQYEDLIREIYGKRKQCKPEIGYPPIYVLQEEVNDEDFKDGDFFLYGLDKAVRVNIGVNEVKDQRYSLLELSGESGGENFCVRFGYNTPNYFKFDIVGKNGLKDYAMALNERPDFNKFMDENGDWFKETTTIWLGLKKFASNSNDIVFGLYNATVPSAWVYILRELEGEWKFIGDIEGQSLFEFRDSAILVAFGSQGLRVTYRLTENGVFEFEEEEEE